jgi:hypothetical protein
VRLWRDQPNQRMAAPRFLERIARCTRSARRNLTGALPLVVAYIDQRPIMYRSIDPLISASRGTLAGDLLWVGAIGFIVAIITGMIG